MKKLMTVAVSALCAAVSFGSDYYVDYANGVDAEGRGGSGAPFKTIAYAVGKSVDNDTIFLVANTHQIAAEVVVDKAVRIVGLGDDRTKVVLKRTASCRILKIENARACVANLTLNANSSGNVGHGACAYVASGTVSNCVLRGCATGTRSCVYLENEDAVLVDSQVSNNSCYDDSVTPGVWVKNGLVLRCVLKDNTSRKRAGAGWLNGAKARVRDSIIENNVACDSWYNPGGGGLYVDNAGAVISNCVFRGNRVKKWDDSTNAGYYSGGAIYFAAAAKVYNCVITNNVAGRDGGGTYGGGTLYNCLVRDNRSDYTVGGGTCGTRVINSLVYGNSAPQGAGGCEGGYVTNSVVLANRNTTDNAVANYSATAVIGHSCTVPLAPGEGNTDADPMIRDLANGDYRLWGGSPLIDAGDDMALDLVSVDWYGKARRLGDHVDIGLDENDPTVIDYSLIINGIPDDKGEPTPAYGIHTEYEPGARIACSVARESWDPSGYTNAACLGYVHEWRQNRLDVPVTNRGDDCSFTMDFGGFDNLHWLFERSFKLTASVLAGGTATADEPVVLEGGSFTVRATPDAHYAFYGWEGDVPGGFVTDNPATFAADGGRAIHAVFSRAWYLDAVNGNDANDGFSPDAAKKTLTDVLAAWQEGDTVYFAAGTYNVSAQIDLPRDVRLIGTDADRTKVVLKRTAGGRVLSIGNAKASVANLTVDGNGGGQGSGNGFLVYVSSGTVTNCVVRNARSGNGRGAIYLDGEDAVLIDSRVTANYTNEDNAPPGIGVNDGLVTGCLIDANEARKAGGGGWLDGAKARLFNSVVENNIGSSTWFQMGAGGILVNNAGAIVSNCVFRGNHANKGHATTDGNNYYNGGGLYFAKPGRAYNCVITNNWAYGFGGGVYGDGTLVNCLVRGNWSTARGGGGTYNTRIVNSLVYGNSAPVGAGGCEGGYVTNSIVLANRNTTDNVVSNCSATAKVGHTCTAPVVAGEGNTDADPMFRDLANGDFRLWNGSALIDAGDDAAADVGGIDWYGSPRLLGEHVDIGLAEYDPSVIDYSLIVDGIPGNQGSPTPAYGNNLQFTSGQQIPCSISADSWDVSGLTNAACVGYIHEWRQNRLDAPVTNRGDSCSFTMDFGGFDNLHWLFEFNFRMRVAVSGQGETSVSEQTVPEGGTFTVGATPAEHHRFFGWTGDVPGGLVRDNPATFAADRGRSVRALFARDWYVDGTNGDDGRDGLTLETAMKSLDTVLASANDGDTIYLAPGTYWRSTAVTIDKILRLVGLGDDRSKTSIAQSSSGRLLYLDNALASVENLTFNENGRGENVLGVCAYVNHGTVTNCVLANSSGLSGQGGVYLPNEDSIVVDSLISGHYTSEDNCPGGIHVVNGLVKGCTISDCRVRKRGAGGWLNGAKARLVDSVVENNTACLNWFHNGGGGILVLDSGAVISNCVFRGNKVNHGREDYDDNAHYNGGAIYFAAAGKAYDCVITNNTAWGFGGAVYGKGVLHRCLIADNHSTSRAGGGTYGGATLVNCTVADCTALGTGGVSGAATLKNSIVWNNADVTDAENPVEANWDTATFTYSCTRPLPDGEGNLCTDPHFFSRRKVGDYLVDRNSRVGKGGEGRTWMGWRAYAVPGLLLMVR